MNNNEFVWDDQPRTLKEIMSAAFLPQVIKVYRAPGETPRDAPPDVMVLVREVGGSRVLAKVHTTDTKSKTEESHVRLVLIPAEYKGWFTLGVKHTPDQLDVIKSIGKVLEIMPHSFLTCSQITCFYELSQPENGADYIKGHIDANETLTVSSMHEGYIKYSNLKGKVKRTLERFLKVSTSSRKIALLRVKQEGLFYIVDLGKNRHTDTYDSVSVRRMKDILARNELPLTVYPLDEKDEFKPKPTKKSAQSQLQTTVELTETIPFRAAVACTLHSRGNQLLELPLQTDVKYLRAVKTPAAKHHEALRKTLIFADSHVDKFLAELRYTSDPGAS